MEQKTKVKLTPAQYCYLDSLNVGDVVKNIPLLNKFGKAGLLKLHEQTGGQVYVCWAQCYTKCYYIDDCDSFQIGNFSFCREYFDGCFSPFLVLSAKELTD
jgi:hypothetical protein